MQAKLPEDSVWAAGVAARLKLLQVTCADAPAPQRRQYLRDTLARALEGMPEARRQSCLAALADQFPAWGGVPPPAEPAEPLSPAQMVKELVAMAPQMAPETRAALAAQLQAARLLPAREPALASEVFKDVQATYGLEQAPDLEQVASLFALLLDLVQKLDEVACKTLRLFPLPPDSPVRSIDAAELQEQIKGFLGAKDAATADRLEQTLGKLLEKHRRGMVALMANSVGIAGAPSTGAEFAKWFLEWFSPQNIEDAARSQNSSWFAAVGLDLFMEKRCWKKYGQRFEELATARHVDQQVREASASTAERIFQLKI